MGTISLAYMRHSKPPPLGVSLLGRTRNKSEAK